MKLSQSFTFLGVLASTAGTANAEAGRRLRGPSRTNNARGLGGIRSGNPGRVADCRSGAACFEEGELCLRETDTEAEECECVYAAGDKLEFRTVGHWTSDLDDFGGSDRSGKSGKPSSRKDSDSGDGKPKSGESSTSPGDRGGEDIPTGCHSGASCSEEGEMCMRRSVRSAEIEECECANIGGKLRFIEVAHSKPNQSEKSSTSLSKSGKSSSRKDSNLGGGAESKSGESSTSPDKHEDVPTGCRSGASCSEEGELCMLKRTRSIQVEECECADVDGKLQFVVMARRDPIESVESSASSSKSDKSSSSKDSESEGDAESKSGKLSTSSGDRDGEEVPTGCRSGASCSEEGELCVRLRTGGDEIEEECECVNEGGKLKFVPSEA